MVICNVCYGSKFSKEAGLYYCVDCHTQVEGWREEDAEFGNVYAAGQYKIISKDIVDIVGGDDFETPEKVLWPTWEVMNHVLVKQVTELEQMPGVAKGLRFTVLSLWSQYLHCRGFVFLKDRKIPHLTLAACKRDYCALTDAKFTAKRKKRRRSRASSVLSSTSVDTSKLSQSVMRGKLKTELAEQLYMSQQMDSLSNVSLDSSNATSIASSERESAEEFFKQHSAINTKNEHIWNRKILVTILCLGLLLTKSEAQVSDLLRWINDGHISYIRIKHLLPTDFNFGEEESHILGTLSHVPTVNEIQTSLERVCNILSIPELPTPDFLLLAKRYIKELNLPEALNELFSKLLSRLPLNSRLQPKFKNGLYNVECRVMAILIVVLKILYGLDDTTEHQVSSIAQTLNAQSPTRKIFCWVEWVEFIEARNALLSQYMIPVKQKFDRNALHTAHHIGKEYEFKDFKGSKTLGEFPRSTLNHQFHNLSQKLSVGENLKTWPSLLPLTTGLLAADEIIQRSEKYATRVLKKDFSLCSLHHSITEDTSIEAVSPLRNFIEASDQKAIQTVKSGIPLPSYVVRIKRYKTHNAKNSTRIKMPGIFKSCNINLSKVYWLLPLGPIDTIFTFNEMEIQLPCTFSWLLHQCAFIISELPFKLYKEVCSIEEKVIRLK